MVLYQNDPCSFQNHAWRWPEARVMNLVLVGYHDDLCCLFRYNITEFSIGMRNHGMLQCVYVCVSECMCECEEGIVVHEKDFRLPFEHICVSKSHLVPGRGGVSKQFSRSCASRANKHNSSVLMSEKECRCDNKVTSSAPCSKITCILLQQM